MKRSISPSTIFIPSIWCRPEESNLDPALFRRVHEPSLLKRHGVLDEVDSSDPGPDVTIRVQPVTHGIEPRFPPVGEDRCHHNFPLTGAVMMVIGRLPPGDFHE